MVNLLEGKVIAMTGAGRGIGRECALLAASEGARVVVNDPGVNPDGSGTDAGPAAEVVEEIKKAGGEAVANFADVSTMEGGESVIKTALETYGKIDGLINLAAILRDVHFAESTAAPLFGNIAKFLLAYYHVEPTNTNTNATP